MGNRLRKEMGWGKFYTYSEYNEIVTEHVRNYSEQPVSEYKLFLNKKHNLPETHKEFSDLLAQKTGNDYLDHIKYGLDYALWADSNNKISTFDLITRVDLTEYDDDPTGLDINGNPKKNMLLMFRPLSVVDAWTRHDNDIDYIEAMLNNDDIDKPTFTELPFSPHPYDGAWMNANVGEQLIHGTGQKLRDLIKISEVSGTEKFNWDMLMPILKEAKFTSWDDLLKNLVPAIPTDLFNLVEWFNPFEDMSELRKFRPMIGTYWS